MKMDRSVGVVFDLDGVLIDSGPLHFESWKRLAHRYGRQFPEELFHETFGMPNFLILPRLFPDRNLTDEEIAVLSEEKERLFRELTRYQIAWLPGAQACLERLKQAHLPLGLYTSTPRSNVDFFDSILHLGRYFNVIVTGDDVHQGKPDPEGFLLAIQKLGIDPKQTVIFEDSPAGIEAGKRAGATVIALSTTHPPDKLRAAEHVLPDLTAVDPDYIKAVIRSKTTPGTLSP